VSQKSQRNSALRRLSNANHIVSDPNVELIHYKMRTKNIYFCEDNSDYNDNDNAVDEVISRQGMHVAGPLKGCVLEFEFPTRCGCNPCSYLLLDNANNDVKRKDL